MIGIEMITLKLTTIGDSTAVVIPEEMLARLKVGAGDTLWAVETAAGYLLMAYEPGIEDQLKAGLAFSKEYRNTFKALAKNERAAGLKALTSDLRCPGCHA
jgi:hypothetical protein